jgi:hypothetical protein
VNCAESVDGGGRASFEATRLILNFALAVLRGEESPGDVADLLAADDREVEKLASILVEFVPERRVLRDSHPSREGVAQPSRAELDALLDRRGVHARGHAPLYAAHG